MRYTCVIIATLACFVLVNQVVAGCLCGITGEDYCESCKGAVRPVPKLISRLVENKFAPIGDKCGCGKQVVEPAIQPKPICPKKTCTCTNNCNCGAPSYPVVPYEVEKPKTLNLPPADPVSVSLAYNAGRARSFAVPEAKLSFGFNRQPINGEKEIYRSNIPEEKLYGIQGEVIKLERRQPKQKPEIIEEVSEEEENNGNDTPYLTYGELGYSLEKFKNPKFYNVAPYKTATIVKESPKYNGKCGFKPGKVVPYREINEGFLYGNGGCYDDV